MVGRTPERVEAVTRDLKIPYGSTDWTAALRDVEPDLVAVATPGGWRREPILAAVAAGCHVFCDKPLEVSADRARELVDAVESAGVKSAFAASFRYESSNRLARELVDAGRIGHPLEVECVSHYDLDPLIPFHWSHRIAEGGGRLSNNFTHKLSIVEWILGSRIEAVMGEVRNDMKRAPVGQRVHDFRNRGDLALPEDEPGVLEWKSVDSEWSYLVVGRFPAPAGHPDPVTALFKHGGMQPRRQQDYISIHGTEGTLFIEEAYGQGDVWWKRKSRESAWERVPLPEEIRLWAPEISPNAERNWTALIREFVADIEGRDHESYLTFADGWRYQVVADRLRNGSASRWMPVNGAR